MPIMSYLLFTADKYSLFRSDKADSVFEASHPLTGNLIVFQVFKGVV